MTAGSFVDRGLSTATAADGAKCGATARTAANDAFRAGKLADALSGHRKALRWAEASEDGKKNAAAVSVLLCNIAAVHARQSETREAVEAAHEAVAVDAWCGTRPSLWTPPTHARPSLWTPPTLRGGTV